MEKQHFDAVQQKCIRHNNSDRRPPSTEEDLLPASTVLDDHGNKEKEETTSTNPRSCSLDDVLLELDESLKVLSALVSLLSLTSESSLSHSRR